MAEERQGTVLTRAPRLLDCQQKPDSRTKIRVAQRSLLEVAGTAQQAKPRCRLNGLVEEAEKHATADADRAPSGTFVPVHPTRSGT
nr:hypothetical protein CFP56_32233 [Quercus suber]